MQHSDRPPFRRRVFFISGFDPRGVLFAHKNCVAETEKWSALTGFPVKTGARKNLGKMVRRWSIDAELPGGSVETSFDFLQWDDIIRQHWEKRDWLVYLQAIGVLFRLARAGVYFRTIRESWPIAIVIASAAVTAVLHGVSALLGLAGLAGLYFFPGILGKALAAFLLVAGGAVLWWVRSRMDRFNPAWTGRIVQFSQEMARSRDAIDGLDQRLDEMADHIIATIEADTPDEALILSHSLGTALATLVAARILRRRPEWGGRDSPLGLVTLGQAQALISFRASKGWYHDEIAGLSAFPDFNWLDFSSPPDGACYALINVLEFVPNRPPDMPKMLNAQFHRIFSAERMNAARDRRMLMHFFYLEGSDYPQIDTDLYDFILLIAGTQTSRRRYQGRASGKPYFWKG
jgi:hypothetical protein